MGRDAVPRVGPISPQAFERDFLLPGRPVIITGAMTGWPALRDWTPRALGERIGGRAVEVAASPSGVFSYQPDDIAYARRWLPFSAAVDTICAPPPEGDRLYLFQKPLLQDYPELASDIETPVYAPPGRALPLFWFGAAGCVTPLHFDAANNWFGEVYGRKHFLIFDPRQTELIYPFAPDSRHPNMSAVNPDQPDLERFPAFRDAASLECVVAPGDLMFLPAFWWHHVRSLEVAISVSFFSPLLLTQWLSPPGLRMLPTLYRRDRLAAVRSFIADAGDLTLIDMARRLLAQGGPAWPAALFAGAALAELPPPLAQAVDRAAGDERDAIPRDEVAALIEEVTALLLPVVGPL